MQFADLELARRIELADAATGRACAKSVERRHPEVGAAILEVGGGVAMFTGIGSPISQAVALGLSGPVAEADVERMESFYRDRGAPVNIELCPYADASLVALLGNRGYRPTEFTNVLVRPLKRREKFPAPAKGIRVRLARRSETELWARTLAEGFAEHFPVTPELLNVVSVFPERPRAVCLLGLVDGELAGGAVLSMNDGLAVLGGASTLPAFRRRGLQTALQQARLKRAAAGGCDLAMTMTLPGSASQRNAERQGFCVVYTRVKLLREWK